MAPEKASFFEELKRRHVWRVAVAYTVVGWLLIQVATQVFPIFRMPDWTDQLVVILVALGFPVALIFAWAFEMTPEGIRRTEPAGSPEARPEHESRQIGRKLNTVIIAVLVLAVALLGWRVLELRHAGDVSAPKPIAAAQAGSPGAAPRSPETTSPDPTAGATPSGLHSAPALAQSAAFNPPTDTLVVLPFANLGGDPKQQYFSDGITEELTNALGQNTALRVIAWDTASKYRDSKQSATDIAKTLDVANVLTGKILRQDNQVRVIVELVNATTGYQTWSSHYDDSLSNIFQVQDKISAAIADALKVKFASANTQRSVNPEAYDLVQQARALLGRSLTAAPIEKARSLLEEAIALDPYYADAHAALAGVWSDLPQYSTLARKDALPKARAEARKALTLDPANVHALVTLANIDTAKGHVAKARAEYRHAIELDPSNADAHMDYALTLPLKQSLTQTLEAVQLDPDSVIAQNNLVASYVDLGQYAQALPHAQKLQRLLPHNPGIALSLAQTYGLLHRHEDAVKAFDLATPDTVLGKAIVAAGRLTYQSLLDPKLRPQALAALDALSQRPDLDPPSTSDMIQLYAVLGEKRAVLGLLPGMCTSIPAACSDLSVNPIWLPLRGDSTFEALVKRYDTTSKPLASGSPSPSSP